MLHLRIDSICTVAALAQKLSSKHSARRWYRITDFHSSTLLLGELDQQADFVAYAPLREHSKVRHPSWLDTCVGHTSAAMHPHVESRTRSGLGTERNNTELHYTSPFREAYFGRCVRLESTCCRFVARSNTSIYKCSRASQLAMSLLSDHPSLSLFQSCSNFQWESC